MASSSDWGRPSHLTDEVREKALKYIESDYLIDELVPTIEGLAVYLGVARKTIYNWRDQQDGFLHIFEQLMAKQAKGVFYGALKGDYNATISKLMLTKHGYSDKQEIDHSSSDGSLRPTTIVLKGVASGTGTADTE